jgi:hypothetical protein
MAQVYLVPLPADYPERSDFRFGKWFYFYLLSIANDNHLFFLPGIGVSGAESGGDY